MGATPTLLYLLVHRVGQSIARRVVLLTAAGVVVVQELFSLAIQQTAAELDPRRLPGRRVQPHHPRRHVAVGVELQEFQIDNPGAGAQGQPQTFTSDIVGRRCATKHLGHAAETKDHRRRLDCHDCSSRHIEPGSTDNLAVMDDQVGEGDIAQFTDGIVAADLVAQRG